VVLMTLIAMVTGDMLFMYKYTLIVELIYFVCAILALRLARYGTGDICGGVTVTGVILC